MKYIHPMFLVFAFFLALLIFFISTDSSVKKAVKGERERCSSQLQRLETDMLRKDELILEYKTKYIEKLTPLQQCLEKERSFSACGIHEPMTSEEAEEHYYKNVHYFRNK